MTLTIDPTRSEVHALESAATWRGKEVLEVGCGDGRLTLRLAALGAARIRALDPSAELVRTARQNMPQRYARRIEYRVGHAERLALGSNTIDRVVFSWVL
jgi:ubiquinone/menaquinone biosynthesis C-methylase UbiE